jgi:hypothetical protein
MHGELAAAMLKAGMSSRSSTNRASSVVVERR